MTDKRKKANLQAESADRTNSYEVASQWKLMAWKFKKHRAAMISVPVLIIMYLICMACEFFAPALPLERFKEYKDSAPTKIHLWDADGNFQGPFVYGLERYTDPYTFRKSYVENDEIVKLGFFVRGSEYKLFGANALKSDIHFFGPILGEDEKPGDKTFFLMGTDSLGRDVFSRILSGGRISLTFCLVSVTFTVFIGLTLGGLSGYLGGVVDTLVQRSIDLIMSIPGIPLWMALAAALPSTMSNLKKYFLMSLIMSLIGWTGLARVTRGKILSLREEDFVIAARLSGSSHLRVIFKHMLPSFMSYIIVSVTGSIPGTILGETTLSFLGLGLQAPTVSWGTLLQDCQTVDAMAATPWLMFPAVFIIVTVLCFCFMGDGMRDAADPYK
jgi:peptide/nickel transport system permease protein